MKCLLFLAMVASFNHFANANRACSMAIPLYSQPVNGTSCIANAPDQSTCEVRCIFGAALMGTTSRQCKDGTYSGSALSCPAPAALPVGTGSPPAQVSAATITMSFKRNCTMFYPGHDGEMTSFKTGLFNDFVAILSPLDSRRLQLSRLVKQDVTLDDKCEVLISMLILPDLYGSQPNDTRTSASLADQLSKEASALQRSLPSQFSLGSVTGSLMSEPAVATTSGAMKLCASPAQYQSTCPPVPKAKAPVVGTAGLVLGIALAIIFLLGTITVVSLLYFKHVRKGCWNPNGCGGEDPNPPEENHDTDFKQQRFSVWEPQLDATFVVRCCWLVGVILLLIGVSIIVNSSKIQDLKLRYDNLPQCKGASSCSVTIPITEPIVGPVLMYYELDGFHQNHRRYIKSIDFSQLRNEHTGPYDNCAPAINYGDVWSGSRTELRSKILYPCGLVAQSFFNDQFVTPTLTRDGKTAALTGDNWKKEGIAWDHDVSTRFVKTVIDPISDQTQWSPHNFRMPAVSDEDFIVWMQVAHMPTFTKLYRQILKIDFQKGDLLNVTINNNYPSEIFSAKKSIIFSNVSSFGGRSTVIGIIACIIGAFSIVMAILVSLRVRNVCCWSGQKFKEPVVSKGRRAVSAAE